MTTADQMQADFQARWQRLRQLLIDDDGGSETAELAHQLGIPSSWLPVVRHAVLQHAAEAAKASELDAANSAFEAAHAEFAAADEGYKQRLAALRREHAASLRQHQQRIAEAKTAVATAQAAASWCDVLAEAWPEACGAGLDAFQPERQLARLRQDSQTAGLKEALLAGGIRL